MNCNMRYEEEREESVHMVRQVESGGKLSAVGYEVECTTTTSGGVKS
jgi:hypothetical protein